MMRRRQNKGVLKNNKSAAPRVCGMILKQLLSYYAYDTLKKKNIKKYL